MDRNLMKFIEEAIDTAREVGEEKRGQARASSLQELQMREQGATQRTQMQTQSSQDIAKMREKSLAQRDSVKGGKASGEITKSQMAKFRSDALNNSRKQLDAMRGATGTIINPATNEAMTAAEEKSYATLLSDQAMSYSLGGQTGAMQPEGAAQEQQASGWVETEGGRRFEVAPGTREGYAETTPAAPAPRSLMTQNIPPQTGIPAPTPTSAPAPVAALAQPQQNGSVAARLRTEYEGKQQAEAPSLARTIGGIASRGARSVGRFAQRIATKPSKSATVSPLGLRGYMDKNY